MEKKLMLEYLKSQEPKYKEKYERVYNVCIQKISVIDEKINALDDAEEERLITFKKKKNHDFGVNIFMVSVLFVIFVRILYTFDISFNISFISSLFITLGIDIPVYKKYLSNQNDYNLYCQEIYDDKINLLLSDKEYYENIIKESRKLYNGLCDRIFDMENKIFTIDDLNNNREDVATNDKPFTRKLERK